LVSALGLLWRQFFGLFKGTKGDKVTHLENSDSTFPKGFCDRFPGRMAGAGTEYGGAAAGADDRTRIAGTAEDADGLQCFFSKAIAATPR